MESWEKTLAIHEEKESRREGNLKLKPFLEKGERIHWIGRNENHKRIKRTMGFLVGTLVFNFVCFFVIAFLADPSEKLITGFLVYFVIYFIFHPFLYLRLKNKLDRTYGITNKRFIVFKKGILSKFWSVKHDDPIYVERDATNNKFDTIKFKGFGSTGYRYKDFENKFLKIKKKEGTDVMNAILNAIYKSDRYAPIYDKLETLNKKYKLDYEKVKPKFVFKSQTRAILKGNIEGMPTRIELENFLPIRRVKIQIECPNIENNAFRISKEGVVNKIKKLGGLEDIEIGNIDLDEQFVFESDNSRFFKTIFNKKIQNYLLRENDWENIEFADTGKIKTKQKNKKQKVVDDPNVLDAHLLEGASIEQQKIEEKNINSSSLLRYEARVDNESETLTKDLINLIDFMLALGLEIKSYQEK